MFTLPTRQESPWWAAERRLLSARLAAPPGTWPGPPLRGVVIVRLHVTPTAAELATAAASAAGMGRKAAAAAVAAAQTAAAARGTAAEVPLQLPLLVPGYPVQSYPVVVSLPLHTATYTS